MTIQVDVVSAEGAIFSGTAEYVCVPAEMGEIGVYPNHAPLLARVNAGMVRIRAPDKPGEEAIFVSGGMLEIQPNAVTILSDTAIRWADLDEAKAIEARSRAEEAMKSHVSAKDFARAEAELARAMAQLQAIERFVKKRG